MIKKNWSAKPNYYLRWEEPRVVKRFSDKTTNDFFQSEVFFLEKITKSVGSVLDIGCASGRIIELFNLHNDTISYTGVDIAPQSIENAKLTYPNANFIVGNALDINLEEKFDLVNATGVFQHEPAFAKLLEQMILWSKKFVLFDIKIGDIAENIEDVKVSFSGSKDNPLYFIILNKDWIREHLGSLDYISRVKVFGYKTSSPKATYPNEIGTLISAGVLLEIGNPGHTAETIFEVNLPEFS